MSITDPLALILNEGAGQYDPENPSSGIMRIHYGTRTVFGYIERADDDLVSVYQVMQSPRWTPGSADVYIEDYLLHIRTRVIEDARYADLDEVRS